MCNLYSVTKGQAAIIALTRALRDKSGNLPPTPGIFPDYSAPIIRNSPDGVRELALARWGMCASRRSDVLPNGRHERRLRFQNPR
jgi:putative SOS response-associated peptidase YedK